MKSFFTALFLLTAFCLNSTAKISKQEKFDPNGGMFTLSGKAPKAFANFTGMALITVTFKANGKAVPIKPQGSLSAGNREYKMTKIFYDGRQFSFESAAIRGVSYKFSGKILDNIKYDASGRTIGDVLEGHLIKLINGKKTAEDDFKFQFEEGD